MEVGYDGTLLAGEGEIERSAYCIHAPMHRLLPDAAAVFHTHMPYASALTRLEDQRILPIGQTELGIMMVTGYDDSYAGPAFDPAEGERLASVIGDKKVLMMANHGVATVGKSVAEAYDLLYYTERVAQVQLLAMSSGRQLKFLPDDVIEATFAAYRKGDVIRRARALRLALRCAEADARQARAGLQGLNATASAARRPPTPRAAGRYPR